MGAMAVHGEYLSPRFVALAHRGGSFLPVNLGIENTMRAFENAVALGYEYVETDVQVTKDGHLIAFHDDNLLRVTDYDAAPSDLLLEEARELLVGDRETIPTLDELFEHFPNVNFNIDIKSNEGTRLLSDCIDRHNAHKRVCVASFSTSRIRQFRKLQPKVPTAASTTGVMMLTTGIVNTKGDVYQVPMRYESGLLKLDLVTPKSIEQIHKAGKKIHVWTIDDDVTMHRLIDWGVDGIVTDRPDLLKGVLRMRGMWSTR